MTKLAGYSLAVSFAPTGSNILRNNGRFPLVISRRNKFSYRLFSTRALKAQLHDKPGVVSRYYLPPWFRCVPGNLCTFSLFLVLVLSACMFIMYALYQSFDIVFCWLNLSVAPMMEWTDNHYRTLARLISKHAWLYTEMVAAETIVHQKDNLDRFLAYSPDQHPIVLQIGGSNIENLAKATELANAYCYDEINLNCGCPSPKVAGHGCFGVSLMLNPKESLLLRPCQQLLPPRMYLSVSNVELVWMIVILIMSFALLNGISPAENRSIPPLKYEYFYGLLRDFPDLTFTINGGITSVEEVRAAREAGAHGVMVGRAAYTNPWHILGHIDSAIYGTPSPDLTRRQVLEKYLAYGESVMGKYGRRPTMRDIVKPLLNLFHSEPGNGLWKRKADAAFKNCATVESFFEETLVAIPDSVLDSPVAKLPPGRRDLFANIDNLLPLPYKTREEEAVVICA